WQRSVRLPGASVSRTRAAVTSPNAPPTGDSRRWPRPAAPCPSTAGRRPGGDQGDRRGAARPRATNDLELANPALAEPFRDGIWMFDGRIGVANRSVCGYERAVLVRAERRLVARRTRLLRLQAVLGVPRQTGVTPAKRLCDCPE